MHPDKMRNGSLPGSLGRKTPRQSLRRFHRAKRLRLVENVSLTLLAADI